MNSEFISTLENVFVLNADPIKAKPMQTYLKNRFVMYGITAPLRDEIIKPFLIKSYLPPKNEANEIVLELWNKPEREFHYFAQKFFHQYSKKIIKGDIKLLEYMIVNQSWWDTVDFIASNLVGNYFKVFPNEIIPTTEQWLNSNNIWLQRTCLLFQLKYKKNFDPELVRYFINRLNGTKEFFINKAIGWILREYSKTQPLWVIDFVNSTALSNLSKREALKHINSKI